jgi:phage terminase large subunit-like protein
VQPATKTDPGPAGGARLPALTPELWAALTEAEQDELAEHLEALEGGESLRDFIARMNPAEPAPRHLDPIIEQLELARWLPRKVCVSLPPGHAKTTLLLNTFAWWLSKYPADTCGYYSYNAQAALAKSVIARSMAERTGVELSDDTNNKAEWRTTAGGGLLAGGVGGGLTGFRVTGLLVLDDPFKNMLDAVSPAYRDNLDDWFKTVALTRLLRASVFVIHTRWHDDDLIGRLKKRGWIVINLPAIAEAADPLGRKEGEALWPDLYPVSALLERRADIGEFNFAALYQGSPRPRGGSVFGAPRYYDPNTVNLEGCRLVLAGDPAASTRTSADYSAAGVLAIKGEGAQKTGYVLHAWRGQVPIPEFARVLRALQRDYGDTAINVEAVGGFKAIPQMLLDVEPDLRINEITPLGDKFTRAQPAAAAWNDGRLLVPACGKLLPGDDPEADRRPPPPWVGPLLDELAKFTGVNDKNDDQVDWISHAWNTDGYDIGDVLLRLARGGA